MRVPKRNAELITKALGLGIWKLGPKEWARINQEKKIGWFNPEVQARGGRIGGASKSPAKIEANRKTFTDRWDDAVYREMMRWHCTPYSAWSPGPSPAQKTARSQKATHTRWHVKPGIRRESCPLCNPRL